MNALEEILASNPLFTGFSHAELQDISSHAMQRTFLDQEILVYQEDVWPYLFLVAEGKIDAVKESPEGRSFIATSLKSGDVYECFKCKHKEKAE